MPNLKIFGSQIHDTAIIFIVTSFISSLIFSRYGEIERSESTYILLISFVVSFFYWFKEYKK